MQTVQKLEESKYAEMWTKKAYRQHSPGMELVDLFTSMLDKYNLWNVDRHSKRDFTLKDYGCGSGEVSLALADRGFEVTAYDITDGGLTYEVREALEKEYIKFRQTTLWNMPEENKASFGYCCDVMEHIPTEYVRQTLHQIIQLGSDRTFFSIAQTPDSCGQLIGKTLHMTVRQFEWWKEQISDFGTIIECRDCASFGVFFVDGRFIK